MRRIVLEDRVIEFRDLSATRTIPELERPRHQSALNDLVQHPKAGEHFQSSWMQRRRSRRRIHLIGSLEHTNRNALLCAGKRGDDPYGAAAANDDRPCRRNALPVILTR